MEISDEYRRTNKSVLAMLNLDVLGYHAENIEDIAIFTDNTDPELTLFLRLLTDEYLQYGRRDRVCDVSSNSPQFIFQALMQFKF